MDFAVRCLPNDIGRGEEAVLKTHVITDADIACFVNGVRTGKPMGVQAENGHVHWEFRFEMPEEDVAVTLQAGDGFFGRE